MKNNKNTNRLSSLKLLTSLTAGLAAVCVLLCGSTADAQVVNFDIPGGQNGNNQGSQNFSGQGAYLDALSHTYWNPIVPNGTTTGVLDSDGVTTNAITFTEAQNGSYGNGGVGAAGTPQGLEYIFAYANNSHTNSCTLSNVPPGTYSLYLYGKNDDAGDANRGAIFTVSVGSTSYGSQSTTNSKDSVFTLNNDYVLFTNVAVGAGGTITFTYTHNPLGTLTSGNTEGDFNGLQLVTTTLINFDVPGGGSQGGIADNYVGQAGYSDPGNNYWNPVVLNGTTSAGLSTNADGISVSPITFTEAGGTYNGGSYSASAQGTPRDLEWDYANIGSGGTKTCSLNNVPAGTYTLYLYGKNDNQGDANRGTTFTVSVGSTSYGNQSTVNSKDTVFTQGNDYVVFPGVVVPANGTITFTYTHNPNATGTSGNTEGDFNGVQLALAPLYPPLITQQPTPERIYAGETATFTAAAVAQPTGSVTYQWQTNGVNVQNGTTLTGAVISGATNAILTVANAGTADQSASYVLTVTASDGLTASSVPVALTIVTPSGEPYEASVLAQHPLHFYEFNEITNPVSGTAVAFDYVGGDNGIYGSNSANGYYGVAGPTPSIGFSGFFSTNAAVEFSSGNATGENVSMVAPWNLNTNSVTITAWVNPNNGLPSVSQQFVFCRGGNTVAGFGYGPTLAPDNNPTLAYTWNNDPETYDWDSGLEVPANQWSFVSMSVTSTNATLSIMNASGLASATHVYSHVVQGFNGTTMVGDDPADTTGANVFAGTIDDVAVFNQALSFSQLSSTFETGSGQADYAPLIAVNPAPQSAYPTLAAQFTVNAGGSGTLSYQWQADSLGNDVYTNLTDGTTSTGSTFSGSLTPTLNIANISSADASDYRVVVTSQYSPAATSAGALLTVLPTGAAENITMTSGEILGEDWNTVNIWSTGLSAYESVGAYPGSTFEVLPGALLRTVASATSVAFPGVQLTIDGNDQFGVPAELELNHASPGTTFTFPSLIMNGGRLDDGNDGLVTIAGALDIVSNTSIAIDPVGTAVNFSVPGSYSGGGSVYVGQGAYADPGHNYWNPVPYAGSLNTAKTSAPATNSDGVTVSTVTMTSTYQFTYNPGGGTQGTPSGLESAYAGVSGSGTLHDSLNNVPAGTYLLYVYGVNGAAGNHDRATTFWVSSDLTPSVTNSTVNSLAGYNEFIQGNDFLVFNVVVGSGGTINISYTADPLVGHDGSNGSGPNTEADFNGLQLVKVVPSSNPRPIEITATLSGTGTIQYSTPDTTFASDLNIAGTANTFSGQWNVVQGTLLGGGANSLGTNSITVGTGGALETLYNIDDPNATLFLNGQLFLHETDTFKSVAVNGSFLAAGTYSAATLATMDSSNFPASWPEQAGSGVSSSSGSVVVLTTPAPVFPQAPTPSALSVYQGQTAQFTVDDAVGLGTVSYDWQANSANLANGNNAGVGTVSGATTTNVSIITSMAGTFNVDVVANSSTSGSTTSSVVTLTVLPIEPPTTATLLYVEAVGADWNTATNWSDGLSAAELALQAPGSTNLVPPGTVVNTPDLGGSTSFPGARLIIQGDGFWVNNPGNGVVGNGIGPGSTTSELRAVELNNESIYFPDLQMAGGQLDNTGGNIHNPNAPQSLGLLELSGEIDIVSNATFYSDSGVTGGSLRTIQIDAWLTGSGTIQYSAFDASFNSNDLLITGTSNTFTGQWNLLQGAVVGTGVGSLGTNSITVGTGAALETAYNINDPNASLTLNGSGEMFLHTSDVFSNVAINGVQLDQGTYSYAELANAFPANFPATWPLQIGSAVNTASGSLTIVSGPPGVPPPQHAAITSAIISAGVLTISGTNGAATGTYYLLGTSNLALPVSQWTVVTSGTYDGSGNFSVQVPVNVSAPAQFYSIGSP